MDDRITEIREALDYLDRTLGSHVYRRDIQPLAAAAREYADLLDSDALIIRRDENGWPMYLVRAFAIYDVDGQRIPFDFILNQIGPVLASSQGVEP